MYKSMMYITTINILYMHIITNWNIINCDYFQENDENTDQLKETTQNKYTDSKGSDPKHHPSRCKKPSQKQKSVRPSPTKKSVKRVLFLLLCLVVTFILQNVILSNLKNTLVITSSAQM